MPIVYIYVREYCDLCAKMLADMVPMQSKFGFELVVVDIDEDDVLESRYAQLIPVAEYQNKVLFYYHMDSRALDAAFGAIG